jgi:hypothetical protein
VKESPKDFFFSLPFSRNSCYPAKISPKEKEKKTHWVRAINKQYSNITTWDLMAF